MNFIRDSHRCSGISGCKNNLKLLSESYRIVLGVLISGTNGVYSGVVTRGGGSESRTFLSTISGLYGIIPVCFQDDMIVLDLNAWPRKVLNAARNSTLENNSSPVEIA